MHHHQRRPPQYGEPAGGSWHAEYAALAPLAIWRSCLPTAPVCRAIQASPASREHPWWP